MRVGASNMVAKTARNGLLDALVARHPALAAHIETVSFAAGTEVLRAGAPIVHVYFPTTGVVSMLLSLRHGRRAEVSTVGNEGMVGIGAWLGAPMSLNDAVQQMGGELKRLPARTVRELALASAEARHLLSCFTAYRLRFADQSVVCNAYHSVEQRACRWLLTVRERAGSNEVHLTHAMLAEMLGVRRQSVTEVLQELQRREAVRVRPRFITIVDPQRVLASACECYEDMREVYREVVGPALAQGRTPSTSPA
jgi:CRP-like cAMP-binding protein